MGRDGGREVSEGRKKLSMEAKNIRKGNDEIGTGAMGKKGRKEGKRKKKYQRGREQGKIKIKKEGKAQKYEEPCLETKKENM